MSIYPRPTTPTTSRPVPITPGAQKGVAQALPSTPQTGTWRHPQFDEISRRQNASNFTDENFKAILVNIGAWVALWIVGRLLWKNFPNFFLAGGPVYPYATWAFRALQVIFAVNIFIASRPLFRKKDDLSDIPLTPAQRKLLGLDPSSRPPTPDSHYVTPPRYKRTSTPLSGSPGSKNSRAESRRGSPASGNQPSTMTDTLYDLRNASGNLDNLVYTSGSTFSPSPNPLLQKATMSGGLSGQRRSSYGSPSPLGPGPPRPITETPGTPTPGPSKGSSVTLNNRWLYDKGRRNSGSRFS